MCSAIAVAGGLRVERQPAAEEVVRVDLAEHDRRIRDRRLARRRARSRPDPDRRPALCGPTRSRPPGSIQTIEPPPAPIDLTSTERMPVMCPIQRPPSHVSAV